MDGGISNASLRGFLGGDCRASIVIFTNFITSQNRASFW